MGCLLVLLVAATVLTGPAGKLTHAARTTTSPAEDFWRAALPGAPMPEAIRDLLRPGASSGTNALDDARPRHHDGAEPPPLKFSYDSDSSSPRNKAAAPSAEVLDRVAGARNDAAASVSPLMTVFFLEEAVRVGGILPFRSMLPRGTTTANDAAAAASPPLRLYTVRAVRAVDGCRFVVCRRDSGAGADDDDAVYGCRATGPARAYVVGMVSERGEAATAAVVCRTDDTSPWSRRARAAFWLWLLGVKPGGAAAVCHAALDAQVIPVKNDDRSSTLV